MKILGVDIGNKGGYFFSDEEYGPLNFTSLAGYEIDIKELIDLYKPNAIICGRPVRYFNTLKMHFAMLAIIELTCEKRGVFFGTTIDSSAKKLILGNGRANKDDIMEWSGINNPDISDAKMFKAYGEKTIS